MKNTNVTSEKSFLPPATRSAHTRLSILTAVLTFLVVGIIVNDERPSTIAVAGHAVGSSTNYAQTREQVDDDHFRSGSKQLRPEMLYGILSNSFGEEDTYAEAIYDDDEHPLEDPAESWSLLLGGLDYENVRTRVREPAPSMPLVMFRMAKGYCQELSESSASVDTTRLDNARTLADDLYATSSDAYREMAAWHFLLRSKPMESDVHEGAEEIVATVEGTSAVDSLTSISQDTQYALCLYFFLMDGGFLLY